MGVKKSIMEIFLKRDRKLGAFAFLIVFLWLVLAVFSALLLFSPACHK
jgi:hypothetical protein